MNMAPSRSGFGEALALAEHRTVPFEYAFRYELSGRPGNVLNRTVTVSIEATFVAVSIGYGVIPQSNRADFRPRTIGADFLGGRRRRTTFFTRYLNGSDSRCA